jgi:hypothetical protein
MTMIDFAKNYSFKEQNEIQSQHWYNWQVTILVHLTFRINPNWDGIDLSCKILTEYHFYVSDDETYDNIFIQHCFIFH